MLISSLKKLFSTLLATTLILSFYITPANANGPCYVVVETVLTSGADCVGEIVIDDTVTSIGANAFLNNTGLTSVTIGNSVSTIGFAAFNNNTALTSVIISNSVTSIGESAFQAKFNNTSLTSLIIGNSVKNIGNNAFLYNTALTSVIIPNSVETIGSGAFGNTGLITVIIPNSVLTLGNAAFNANTSLTSVVISNSLTVISESVFLDNTALLSVTIPSSVTSIGDYAFYNNTALTSVVIPDSVLTIGDGAFQQNTALTAVSIGKSVTTIGTSAFRETAFTSVTIPDSVLTIGNNAFSWNALISSVTFLGNAPTSMGTNVFLNVAAGATANVAYNATGFPADGELWNGLIVVYGSAPVSDSVSSSTTPTSNIITPLIIPVVAKTADASIKLKNRTYVSKNTMKMKLRKNKLYKFSATDRFTYKVLRASRNSCGMRGNYVMGYENSKVCDLHITRTNAKGISNKYWVKINYLK